MSPLALFNTSYRLPIIYRGANIVCIGLLDIAKFTNSNIVRHLGFLKIRNFNCRCGL